MSLSLGEYKEKSLSAHSRRHSVFLKLFKCISWYVLGGMTRLFCTSEISSFIPKMSMWSSGQWSFLQCMFQGNFSSLKCPLFFLGSSLWNIILTRTPRTLMPLTNLKSSTMPMLCCLTSLRGTFMTSTAPWVSMCRSSSGRRMWTRTSCSPAGGQRCSISLISICVFSPQILMIYHVKTILLVILNK